MNKFNQEDIQVMVKAVINELSSKNKDILEEGKRDNQLIPYLNALCEKTGQNISLGQFKTMMLQKLSSEGCIHNLSLASNFYLVGAVKYYFNGDLTLNKNLSIFSEGSDDWNSDVCRKLNALILILRNEYIGSVGTTWAEPEDFGNLPIKALFKKYNTKISSVIKKGGDAQFDIKEKNVDAENLPPSFPDKEYDYEILFNFEIARKYCEATSPGSWCITYGENHFSYYTNRGNGHFVVFKRKGYENIPREVQKEKWQGNKPQDDYGNSLIAYLQSNSDPGPANYNGGPLITSRWNHGYSVHCEADRAYTQAEFEQITGYHREDLAKIFKYWKDNAPNYGASSAIAGQIPKDAILALKYIQMRINGGENPVKTGAISETGVKFIYNIDFNGTIYYFLFNGKKIFFETISLNLWSSINTLEKNNIFTYYSFFGNNVKYFIIYNARLHKLLYVDDCYMFKSVGYSTEDYYSMRFKYFEVAKSKKCLALINLDKFEPLKLPNGQVWYNDLNCRVWRRGNKTTALCVPEDIQQISFTYDESSGESYYFDTLKQKFIVAPKMKGWKQAAMPWGYDDILLPVQYEMYAYCRENADISFQNSSYYGDIGHKRVCLFKNGKLTNIYTNFNGNKCKLFYDNKEDIPLLQPSAVNSYGTTRIILFKANTYNKRYAIFNNRTMSVISLDNEAVLTDFNYQVSPSVLFRIQSFLNGRYLGIPGIIHPKFYPGSCAIFDLEENKFVKNPLGYPDDNSFYIVNYNVNDKILVYNDKIPNYYIGYYGYKCASGNENFNINKFPMSYFDKNGEFHNTRGIPFSFKHLMDNVNESVGDIYCKFNEKDLIEMVNKVTAQINEINNRKLLK